MKIPIMTHADVVLTDPEYYVETLDKPQDECFVPTLYFPVDRNGIKVTYAMTLSPQPYNPAKVYGWDDEDVDVAVNTHLASIEIESP